MRGDFYKQLTSNLETARAEGLFKEERIITSAQQADITVGDSHVINFCANNYLGLGEPPGTDCRGEIRHGQPRFRDGLGTLHLRHPGYA